MGAPTFQRCLMVNRIGKSDNFNRWKPATMRNYLTMTELSRRVGRDRSRIKQLERAGVIPKPIRVKVGELQVRLYSPADVRKIERHFEAAKPGRPRT